MLRRLMQSNQIIKLLNAIESASNNSAYSMGVVLHFNELKLSEA